MPPADDAIDFATAVTGTAAGTRTAEPALRALTVDDAAILGPACARLDPWLTYGTPAATLTIAFTLANDASHRFAISTADGLLAGVAIVRRPWLVGPYIQFLAVLPEHQGRGVATAVVARIEHAARLMGDRNLWICVSHFNLGAQALYARLGFEHVATLPALLAETCDELLLRKRLC